MLLPILLQEQKKFVKVRVWRWSRASFRIAGEGILREKEGANSLSFISNRTEQFLDLVLLVSQENNYGGSVMWWPNLWLFDINFLSLYKHILLLISCCIFSFFLSFEMLFSASWLEAGGFCRRRGRQPMVLRGLPGFAQLSATLPHILLVRV